MKNNANNKGQALLELAILGAVLILLTATFIQWGMAQNNNQRLQMDAFRFAYYANDAYGVGASGNSTSVVVIKDLPRPDIQNKFGFMERSPQMAAASLTRSINLMGTPTYGSTDALPSVILKVGNKEEEFTTAGYKEDQSKNWRKQISIKGYSHGSPCWKWATIDVQDGDVSYMGIVSEPKMYYTDENGDSKELKEGMTADFDGDGEEELLLEIVTQTLTDYIDSDGDGNPDSSNYDVINGVKFMDFQEGEIDLTAEVPAQGYKGDYESTITGASASITRGKDGVTSHSVTGRQTVTHHINVQDGGSAGTKKKFSIENIYDLIDAN